MLRLKILKNSLLGNKCFLYLLFTFVAFLFVGRSIDFHFLTHFINGGDTWQWLNFPMFFEKGLLNWESTAPGRFLTIPFWWIIYTLPLYVIKIFVGNNILAINIFWILILTFSQFIFYKFYSIFIREEKNRLLAALLTFFNVFFIMIFYTPVHHAIICFTGFPLLFFLSYKYFERKEFLYCFLYALSNLLLFRTINVLIIINITVFVLLFFYLRRYSFKNYFKSYFRLAFLSIIICSLFIINILGLMESGFFNQATEIYNVGAIKIDKVYSLGNTFRLVGFPGFIYNTKEEPGKSSFYFSRIYLKNPFLILISSLPFLLFFFSLFKRKKEYYTIVFSLSLIIFIFLAKMTNPPLEFINKTLYKNAIYLSFFRSGWKYFMYFIIPLLIILIFKNNRKKFLFYSLIFIYILIHFSIIFIFGKPINKYWNTHLPNTYNQIDLKISQIKDINKILILPVSSHLFGYRASNDGYAGPERLYMMNNKTYLTKAHTTSVPTVYTDRLEEIRKDYNLINKYYNILNYKYLLLEKNIDSEIKFPMIASYKEVETAIDKNLWNNIYQNEDFDIYEIDDSYLNGRIYLSNSKMSFQRINSTKYKIYIEGIKEKQDLSFIETFNNQWKLYLNKNSIDKKCNPLAYYGKTKTTECRHLQKLFEGEEFKYLWQQPIFNNSHRMVYGYANGWTISPEYIKQNFSKEYYKENLDGSIDLELVLYFKPQSYYYIGLLISALTLLSCLGYLGYNWCKRKHLKLVK